MLPVFLYSGKSERVFGEGAGQGGMQAEKSWEGRFFAGEEGRLSSGGRVVEKGDARMKQGAVFQGV